MNQYVYHFKPQDMTGDTLFPLNDLRDSYPELYQTHVKKYQGREATLQETIPLLDCLWNDVLHFSPINPQIILETWRKEGLYEHTRIAKSFEVFKIPIELIDENAAVCFRSFNFDFDRFDPSLRNFWNFKKSDFIEQTQVHDQQIEVWKNDFKAGRRLFWYSHILHILARQTIETKLCELTVCY